MNSSESKFHNQDGFTLVELLIASAMSLTVIAAGYVLLTDSITLNKREEEMMELDENVANSLELIVDEITSSKRIISNIREIPAACKKPIGSFVIGMILPEQVLKASDYRTKTFTKRTEKTFNCPIIYSLRPKKGLEPGPYVLERTGPEINESGFYVAGNSINSLVSDAIAADVPSLDKITCASGFKYKEINGIQVCTDKYRKSAEVAISSSGRNKGSYSVSTNQTTSGFSRIKDEELTSGTSGQGGGNICKTGTKCSFLNNNLSNDNVSFVIDVSGSMGFCAKGYPYNYGFRYRGGWDVYCRSGESRMDIMKRHLLGIVSNLKENSGVKLQISSFSWGETRMFQGGPREVTVSSKNYALNWISRLRSYGGTNPWPAMNRTVQLKTIGQIFLLSDGQTHSSGSFLNRRGKYADLYSDYNDKEREGNLTINSISFMGPNNCGSGWMGDIARLNGGTCSVVK